MQFQEKARAAKSARALFDDLSLAGAGSE